MLLQSLQYVVGDGVGAIELDEVDGEATGLQQLAQFECWCDGEDGVLCAVGLEDVAAGVRFREVGPVVLFQQCAGEDGQQRGLELEAECDAGGHHGSLREASDDAAIVGDVPALLHLADGRVQLFGGVTHAWGSHCGELAEVLSLIEFCQHGHVDWPPCTGSGHTVVSEVQRGSGEDKAAA